MNEYGQNKRRGTARSYSEEANFSGQHLLHNKAVIGRMIKAANLKPSETVLEIGAGRGAITFRLAERVSRVIAVENDPRFIPSLREKAADYPHVDIVQEDIRRMRLPTRPYCVVANIPYAITTAILDKLLGPQGQSFQRGVLLIEKGAAIRFTSDRTSDSRLLTWRMQYRLKVVGAVDRSSFSPPPRVDSAILSITRRSVPLLPLAQLARFSALADYALRSPRQSVYDALYGIFTAPQLKHVCRQARIERSQPVAALSEEQWGIVFKSMTEHVNPIYWPKQRKRQ